MYSKQTNKIWSLKDLVMLKCEGGTSPYVAQVTAKPCSDVLSLLF